jgi:hypothetical protein
MLNDDDKLLAISEGLGAANSLLQRIEMLFGLIGSVLTVCAGRFLG